MKLSFARGLATGALTCVALAFGAEAMACQWDSDCPIGVTCERDPGAAFGQCIGRAAPTPAPPDVDDVAPSDPSDGFQVQGRPCRFDVECQPGGSCKRSEGQLDGYCIKP